MNLILNFLIGITCFLTLPALTVIIVQLHANRLKEDKSATPYLVWLLANPAGVALIPLITFLLLILYRARWNFVEAFTKPEISGNVLVPVVFTAVLAIGNLFYKFEQKDKKMEIVEELKAWSEVQRAEDQKKYEAQRAEDQKRYEAQRAEDQKRYEAQVAESEKRFQALQIQTQKKYEDLQNVDIELLKKQAYLQGQIDAREGKTSPEYQI